MIGRCCCKDTGCLIIDVGELVNASDFFKVFSSSSSFEMRCEGDSDPETGSVFSSDAITFTGSANLDLIYPAAIFNKDNLSISIGNTRIENIEAGDQITEQVTFTLGRNTLTLLHSRNVAGYPGYMYNESCSCTLKYNNTLLYTRQEKESGTLDHILGGLASSSILSLVHSLIRKEKTTGQQTERYLYYYLKDYMSGEFLVGISPDEDIEEPIHFSYSFTSSNPDTTITFDSAALRIWKPDKWWKYRKYQDIAEFDLGHLSPSESNEYYNIVAYTEAEDANCESIEYGVDYSSYTRGTPSNSDIVFTELSPNIALRFGGFKSSKSYISAIPIRAEWWTAMGDTPNNELETIYYKIREEEAKEPSEDEEDDDDEYDTINGLKTSVIDLDGIMTAQASSWDNAGYYYVIEWYNGAIVSLKYDAVESQVLNAVTGGDYITFQQMSPVTVMKNQEWYSSDITDEWGNDYHGGFRSLHWCHDSKSPYGPYGICPRHVDNGEGLSHLCRWDPFFSFPTPMSGKIGRDVFAITDTTLTFRRCIIAPNIRVNISPKGIYTLDLIFKKPNTSEFSQENWRTPHIVDVAIVTSPSAAEITKSWYEENDVNPKQNREDPSSPLGGYYKLQYFQPAGGDDSVKTDYFTYKLIDQFGGESIGKVMIYFTGTTINEHITQEVEPSIDSVSACQDYDTLCEIKCSVPGATRTDWSGNQEIVGQDIYLYYVHDGKTCTLSDLISNVYPRRAELKTPAFWTDISGTVQDAIYAEFVPPVYECTLAHDYNFGLENSILQKTDPRDNEPDNVDYLNATLQLWEYPNGVPTRQGNPFIVKLNPDMPVGCPSSSEIGLSHRGAIGTTYKGTVRYVSNGSTVTREISLGSSESTTLPYQLGDYIFPPSETFADFEITKITIVYTSGKEIELSLSGIYNTTSEGLDYPQLVLGDFYND